MADVRGTRAAVLTDPTTGTQQAGVDASGHLQVDIAAHSADLMVTTDFSNVLGTTSLIVATQADAVDNATDSAATTNFNMVFNGTTWDRVREGGEAGSILVDLGTNNDVTLGGDALTALQLIDDTVFADDAAFTPGTSKVDAIGYLADDTASDPVDEGDIGIPRMTLTRKPYAVITDPTSENNAAVDGAGHLQVDIASDSVGIGGGTQYTLGTDTYTETTTIGTVAGAVRNDTLAALASTDNEIAPLQVDANGALYIQEGSALDVSAATVTVDSELPAAAALADDASNPTAPAVGGFMMGYDSGNTNWNRVEVDDAGHLQVDVLSGASADTPTSPATDVTNVSTPVSIAAGASSNLDSADLASKRLWQAHVAGAAPFKVIFSTLTNGTPTVVGVAFGDAFHPVIWTPPHRDFVQSGSSAGADGFRAAVTNLDPADTTDFYAAFFYADN